MLPVLRFVCPSPCACIKYSIVEATELSLPSCLTLNVLDGIRAVIGGGAEYWKRHYSSYGFDVARRLVPGKFQVAFPSQVGYFDDHSGAILRFTEEDWLSLFHEAPSNLTFPQYATVHTRTKIRSIALFFDKDKGKFSWYNDRYLTSSIAITFMQRGSESTEICFHLETTGSILMT